MKIYLAVVFVVIMMVGGTIMLFSRKGTEPASEKGLLWFKRESNAFATSAIYLKEAVRHLRTNDSEAVNQTKKALKKCRLQYKRIAFFLEYYFPEEASIFNGPPVQEVENTQEFREPLGLQVIESFLFTGDPAQYRHDMLIQADMLARRAASFSPLLADFKTHDNELLKGLYLELIRVITVYITGYDAPQLKTGIEEAHESLATIELILQSDIKSYKEKDSIEYYLAKGKEYLKLHPDFDSFNRLFFITHYALPIQKQFNTLINETAIEPGRVAAFNSPLQGLFSPEALNKKAFPHTEYKTDSITVNLGKRLFFETGLSGNSSRSCGSCHVQEAFFSDRLFRNKNIEGTADLPRNTPTLLYACYQYAQFWDGRVKGLEDQIDVVLKSKVEMNSSPDSVIKRLSSNPAYAADFKNIWPKKPAVTFQHIAAALAAYIRTLTPFHSPFDRYIKGDQTALTASQQRGFNLFMGKGQCGTCHFAPLFNGLLPPDYNTTEFEVLGIPSDDNLTNPHLDMDEGRYTFHPFAVYKGAFKTPTVRNAAVTAPYMHNGRFSSLEKVIEFYDKGGGAGLGLHVPEQTLSSAPLHLNKQEKKDIVAFIEALTDNDR